MADPRNETKRAEYEAAHAQWQAVRWEELSRPEGDERDEDARKADKVFTEGGVALDVEKLAKRLRGDLSAAGVSRSDLFSTGDNKGQLRAHDLRATFITLALANGSRRRGWRTAPVTRRRS